MESPLSKRFHDAEFDSFVRADVVRLALVIQGRKTIDELADDYATLAWEYKLSRADVIRRLTRIVNALSFEEDLNH